MSLTISEHDLMIFFAQQGKRVDDTPWPYTSATYQLKNSNYVLSFEIWPAMLEVNIVITYQSKTWFEFRGRLINDIRFLQDNRNETLLIEVHDCHQIFLSVSSDIVVRQEYDRNLIS